jgi:hypothetical protein
VGRSFDGGHYVYNRPGLNITAIGAIPTRGVFQVDGWGQVDVGLGYLSMTKPISRGRTAGELRLFGIYYNDWRNVLKVDNRPLIARALDTEGIRIGTFGGHYLHAAETGAGTVDFVAWGALQAGSWGLLDHRAGSGFVEAGIQPRGVAGRPWIRGGFHHGSGDGNGADNRHGTFFQLLPTPRPFARFPFFNMMNNQDLYAVGILRPHAQVTVSTEVHGLWLAQREDLWYAGGGAFQPWSFGYLGRPSLGNRSLATLWDVSTEVRATPYLTLVGYFGQAHGRDVLSALYGRQPNGRFGYIEALYRF